MNFKAFNSVALLLALALFISSAVATESVHDEHKLDAAAETNQGGGGYCKYKYCCRYEGGHCVRQCCRSESQSMVEVITGDENQGGRCKYQYCCQYRGGQCVRRCCRGVEANIIPVEVDEAAEVENDVGSGGRCSRPYCCRYSGYRCVGKCCRGLESNESNGEKGDTQNENP